jgi:hypothetical protein
MISAVGRDPALVDSVSTVMFDAGPLSGTDVLRGTTARLRPASL